MLHNLKYNLPLYFNYSIYYLHKVLENILYIIFIFNYLYHFHII